MTVTIADIKTICIPAANLSDEALTMCLDTAVLIVDENVLPKCPMSDSRYDKLVLYLACHFVALTLATTEGSATGGALIRDKLGQADQSYAAPDVSTFGLQSTRWGQMALVLDSCGILAGLNASNGLKAQFRVVRVGTGGLCNE